MRSKNIRSSSGSDSMSPSKEITTRTGASSVLRRALSAPAISRGTFQRHCRMGDSRGSMSSGCTSPEAEAADDAADADEGNEIAPAGKGIRGPEHAHQRRCPRPDQQHHKQTQPEHERVAKVRAACVQAVGQGGCQRPLDLVADRIQAHGQQRPEEHEPAGKSHVQRQLAIAPGQAGEAGAQGGEQHAVEQAQAWRDHHVRDSQAQPSQGLGPGEQTARRHERQFRGISHDGFIVGRHEHP